MDSKEQKERTKDMLDRGLQCPVGLDACLSHGEPVKLTDYSCNLTFGFRPLKQLPVFNALLAGDKEAVNRFVDTPAATKELPSGGTWLDRLNKVYKHFKGQLPEGFRFGKGKSGKIHAYYIKKKEADTSISIEEDTDAQISPEVKDADPKVIPEISRPPKPEPPKVGPPEPQVSVSVNKPPQLNIPVVDNPEKKLAKINGRLDEIDGELKTIKSRKPKYEQAFEEIDGEKGEILASGLPKGQIKKELDGVEARYKELKDAIHKLDSRRLELKSEKKLLLQNREYLLKFTSAKEEPQKPEPPKYPKPSALLNRLSRLKNLAAKEEPLTPVPLNKDVQLKRDLPNLDIARNAAKDAAKKDAPLTPTMPLSPLKEEDVEADVKKVAKETDVAVLEEVKEAAEKADAPELATAAEERIEELQVDGPSSPPSSSTSSSSDQASEPSDVGSSQESESSEDPRDDGRGDEIKRRKLEGKYNKVMDAIERANDDQIEDICNYWELRTKNPEDEMNSYFDRIMAAIAKRSQWLEATNGKIEKVRGAIEELARSFKSDALMPTDITDDLRIRQEVVTAVHNYFTPAELKGIGVKYKELKRAIEAGLRDFGYRCNFVNRNITNASLKYNTKRKVAVSNEGKNISGAPANADTFFSIDIHEVYRITEAFLKDLVGRPIKLSDEAKTNILELVEREIRAHMSTSHGAEQQLGKRINEIAAKIEVYIDSRKNRAKIRDAYISDDDKLRILHKFHFSSYAKQELEQVLLRELNQRS